MYARKMRDPRWQTASGKRVISVGGVETVTGDGLKNTTGRPPSIETAQLQRDRTRRGRNGADLFISKGGLERRGALLRAKQQPAHLRHKHRPRDALTDGIVDGVRRARAQRRGDRHDVHVRPACSAARACARAHRPTGIPILRSEAGRLLA